MHPSMYSLRLLALCALPLCAAVLPVHAAPPAAASLEWDLRVRYEGVQGDALAGSADAATARLRLGLRLIPAPGWTGLLEGEAIAGNQRYNSGANGRTAYPAVIDPRGVELNQAWLGWKGARAGATLGRQRLLFDNQRWKGAVVRPKRTDWTAVEAGVLIHINLRRSAMAAGRGLSLPRWAPGRDSDIASGKALAHATVATPAHGCVCLGVRRAGYGDRARAW